METNALVLLILKLYAIWFSPLISLAFFLLQLPTLGFIGLAHKSAFDGNIVLARLYTAMYTIGIHLKKES